MNEWDRLHREAERYKAEYHGSPMYKYKTISNNPKWLELYRSVECLDDYFRHSKEPQWQKEIEPEMDEDEDFGMAM